MSGFFNRLAQRTLGTAQIVRPSIGSRFAQVLSAANEFPSTDAIEDVAQQSSEMSNANEIPKWQKSVNGYEQATHMDSPHLQEQHRQTELRQAENRVDPHPGRYEKQPEPKEHDATIVNSDSVETKSRFDPFKPVVDTSKGIVKPIIPALTGTKRVPSVHPNQTDLEHDQFTGKKPRAVEATLLPIPYQQPNNIVNSDASFNDFGYPMDVHRVSGKEDLQSTNTRKQQHSDESQAINVTIGRIEVRAIHPSPTPIKRSKEKTNSALLLDDYLQQRQKGER